MKSVPAKHIKYHGYKQRGISLIEVLVSIIVTSIGLLGVAATLTYGMKINHGAHLYGMAVSTSQTIIESMRSNQSQASSGSYDFDSKTGLEPCEEECTSAEISLSEWQDYITQSMPSSHFTITTSPTSTGTYVTIEIEWSDAASAQARSYTLESVI